MKNSVRQVTIYDIAKRANVSATTVSRALNNSGYVAQEKLDEILRIARELKYSPNQVARMLKNQATSQVMLSIPDMRNSFYNDFIEAVNGRAEENNHSLLLNYNQMKDKTKHKMLDDLAENHFDGLILVSIHLDDALISRINAIGKPIVLTSISTLPPIQWKGDYDFVGVDTRAAMYMAAKHLIEQGHRRIAYVGLDEESLTGRERFEGYTIALKEAGIPLQKDLIYEGGYDARFGYESAMKMAQSGELPTAMCACNDVLATGAYRALEEAGVSIPDQIAIVGMDDSDVCSILRPRLSSVSLCSGEMGDAAARLLFKRLQDPQKRYESVLFEPKLMVRGSSSRTVQ